MSATSSDAPDGAEQIPDLPAGVGLSEDPDASIPFTRHDIAAAARVLEQAGAAAPEAEGAPSSLLSLTDEQLVGLDGHRRRQFTALPWLGEDQEERRRFAAHVGLRALVASGRVGPVVDEGSGERRWVADAEISGCLLLRRTAEVFISAERTVQAEQGPRLHRLHHYAHPGGVLEEEVTASGLHHFTPLQTGQAHARLLALADPGGIGGDGGETVELRASELAAGHRMGERLAGARAVTVLTTVRTADDEVREVSVYATASELLAMEAVDPTAGDPQLRVRVLGSSGLAELIAALVPGSLSPPP